MGKTIEFCDASSRHNPTNRIPIQGKCYDNKADFEVKTGYEGEDVLMLCGDCARKVKKAVRGEGFSKRRLTKREREVEEN